MRFRPLNDQKVGHLPQIWIILHFRLSCRKSWYVQMEFSAVPNPSSVNLRGHIPEMLRKRVSTHSLSQFIQSTKRKLGIIRIRVHAIKTSVISMYSILRDYRKSAQCFNSFSIQLCEHVCVLLLRTLRRMRSEVAIASKSETHACYVHLFEVLLLFVVIFMVFNGPLMLSKF